MFPQSTLITLEALSADDQRALMAVPLCLPGFLAVGLTSLSIHLLFVSLMSFCLRRPSGGACGGPLL